MTQSFDIAELLALAKDNAPESRSRLFGLMGDLFLNKGGYLSTEERSNLSEILSTLLPQADKESRLKLAYDLSGSTAVPRDLARRIAEDEIEVASPILFKSTKLTDQDLIELSGRSPEHAGVIATRRGLPMTVADTLMRAGQVDVVQALLDNASAQISIAALHAALDKAKSSEDLQDSISRRVELPEEIAAELMEWAGDRVRDRLMDRFNILMVEIAPPLDTDEELPPLDLTQFNKANGVIVEPEPDVGDLPPTGFARYGATSNATPSTGVTSSAPTPVTPQTEVEAEDERLEAERLAEAEAARAKAKKDLVAKTLAALAQDSHAEPVAPAAPSEEARPEEAQPDETPAEEVPVEETPVEETLALDPVVAPAPADESEFVEAQQIVSPPLTREPVAERLSFGPVDMELELIDVGDSGEMPALAEPIARTDRAVTTAGLEMGLELEFEAAPVAEPKPEPARIEPAVDSVGVDSVGTEPVDVESEVEEPIPAEPVVAEQIAVQEAAVQPMEEPPAEAASTDDSSMVETIAEATAETSVSPEPEPDATREPEVAVLEPAQSTEPAPSAEPATTQIETPAMEPVSESADPEISTEPRKEGTVVTFFKSALTAAAKAMPGSAAETPAADHKTATSASEEPVAPESEAKPVAEVFQVEDLSLSEIAPSEQTPEPVAELAKEPEVIEPVVAEAAVTEPAAAAPATAEPIRPAARAAIPKGAEHKLTTALLIAVLNNGGLAHAEAMFAQMTGLRIGLVRRLAAEGGGEGLAMAARAIHMSREDFSTIYLLWRKLKSRDGFVPASEHGKALDFFDSAPQERVLSVINRWRKDPEKLFATG